MRGAAWNAIGTLQFVASGLIEDLLARTAAARTQLEADIAAADPDGALRGNPPAAYRGPDIVLTQGGALQHVYEELAQHHGQMELVRDVLMAAVAE